MGHESTDLRTHRDWSSLPLREYRPKPTLRVPVHEIPRPGCPLSTFITIWAARATSFATRGMATIGP